MDSIPLSAWLRLQILWFRLCSALWQFLLLSLLCVLSVPCASSCWCPHETKSQDALLHRTVFALRDEFCLPTLHPCTIPIHQRVAARVVHVLQFFQGQAFGHGWLYSRAAVGGWHCLDAHFVSWLHDLSQGSGRCGYRAVFLSCYPVSRRSSNRPRSCVYWHWWACWLQRTLFPG